MGTGEINTVPTESNEKIEIKCKDVNEIMPRDKEKSIISNLRELANNKPTKRDSKTPEICNRIVKDETDYRHRDIEKERREQKRHESNRRNLNRERDYRYYERKHREEEKKIYEISSNLVKDPQDEISLKNLTITFLRKWKEMKVEYIGDTRVIILTHIHGMDDI